MGNKILFTNCHIRFFDVRIGEAGTLCSKLHVTTSLTKEIREKMAWTLDPALDGVKAAKLDGELLALHMELTPTDKELASHSLDIDIKSVNDFQVFRVEGENSTHTELRFTVTSAMPNAAALAEAYIGRIGEGHGALVISYSKQLTLGELTPGDQEGVDA